jgi:hypothetical protein
MRRSIASHNGAGLETFAARDDEIGIVAPGERAAARPVLAAPPRKPA